MMQSYPHTYRATAEAKPVGMVQLTSGENAVITSAPPLEFGGPGGLWSPEQLLVAAVSDCYVLSFQALAKSAHFSWETIQCEATGTLERVGTTTKFTTFELRVVLSVASKDKVEKGYELLTRAEGVCFITNSMSANAELYADVQIVG